MIPIEVTPDWRLTHVPAGAFVYGRKSRRKIEVGATVRESDGDLVVTRHNLGAYIPASAVQLSIRIP